MWRPSWSSREAAGPRCFRARRRQASGSRSEEHTSELQSHVNLVCRLLLEKKKQSKNDSVSCAYTQGNRAHFSASNQTVVAINNVFSNYISFSYYTCAVHVDGIDIIYFQGL